jgi:hypothetical protein
LGVVGQTFGRVEKQQLEKDLQGRISEKRNDYLGTGCMGGIFVLRQLTDMCPENLQCRFKESI